MAGPSSRQVLDAVLARVVMLAGLLHRTLVVVTAALGIAAVTTFAGFALADDGNRSGLLLGGLLGGSIALVAGMELFFTRDVGRARQLRSISREEWAGAARTLAGRAAAGERAVAEATGVRSRLLRLVKGLWALKGDLDTLAEGGLAPAVSLAKALVPARLLTVAAAAVASPFLLAFGLLVLTLGLTAP